MNELQTTRTLDVVAAEIRTFTASMLNNIIEIGRRMCEAKELLPHGEFGEWVKANTGYSKSTANNFMRLFQEYGEAQGSLFGAEVANVQAFGNLSYTKALALLQVPSEEREAFVENHDVEAMTTRELEQAIRERDEAKKAAEDALREAAVSVHDAEQAMDEARASAMEAKKEADAIRAELEELRSRPVEVAVREPDPAELEKIRAEEARKAAAATAELEKKLAAAEAKAAKEAEKAKKLKEKVDKAGEEAKAAMQKDIDSAASAQKEAEAAKAAAEARAKALEDKLKTADGDAAVFKVYFSSVQEQFNKLHWLILKADAAKAEGYRSALRALLDSVGKML